MRKRMKALAALLCVTAMVTGCGSPAADSGTSSAKTEIQKEEGAKETEKDGEKKSEVTIGFSSEGDSFDPCTGFGYVGSRELLLQSYYRQFLRHLQLIVLTSGYSFLKTVLFRIFSFRIFI